MTSVSGRDECCAVVLGGAYWVVGAGRLVAMIATESTFYSTIYYEAGSSTEGSKAVPA